MKRFICLIMVLLMLGSVCACTQQDEVGTPGENDGQDDVSTLDKSEMAYMTVYCHNVYYLDMDRRADNMLDLFKKMDGDVILLQEVSQGWIPYIERFMEENNYSYYAYGRYGGEFLDEELEDGDAFSPILWKTDKYDLVDSGHFWFSSTPDIVRSAKWIDGTNSDFPRCQCWVILRDKETGREIVVASVHTDAYNATVRLYSCDLLVKMMDEISEGRPVVMGGDWNMGYETASYELMQENGYPDIRYSAEITTMSGAWNNFGQIPDDELSVGDLIFISEGNIDAEVFRVLTEEDVYDGEHISDHCPIFAEFYY